MEVDNQAGTNVLADRVDRRLPVPAERPVAELRLTRAGEDPVQAQLVLPLLTSGPACPGLVLDPHLVLPRLLRGRSASREKGGEVTNFLLLLLDQDVEAFADLLNIGAEDIKI